MIRDVLQGWLAELDEREAQLKSLREAAGESDAELILQREVIAILRRQIAEQAEAAADAGRRIQDYDETISALEAEIAALRERVVEPEPSTPEPPIEPPVVTLPSDGALQLPAMIVRPYSPEWPIDAQLELFKHTGRRDWNFGGHDVPWDTPGWTVSTADVNQGYWHPDTSGAAYLFDRATAEYQYHLLTGDSEALAVGDEYFHRYVSLIGTDGYFSLKKSEKDTKYLYAKCFWLHAQIHGAGTIEQYLPLLARMWKNVQAGYKAHTLISAKTMWTERESWVHGEFAWFYHLITGDTAARDYTIQVIQQYGDGVNRVTYTRHEGGLPGGAKESVEDPNLVTSLWMSALYFQFARCVLGHVSEELDQLILTQVANYCNFLDEPFVGVRGDKQVFSYVGYAWGEEYHAEHRGILSPRYLTCQNSLGKTIGESLPESDDQMHAIEILGLLHFGRYAMQILGQDTADISEKIALMEKTALHNFGVYTRIAKDMPRYRLKPARFWIMWLRARCELIA